MRQLIKKIIWSLRSTKQRSIGCSHFEIKHFNRSPNKYWIYLVSHAINSDKGNSIVSKERAQGWGAKDIIEDGYLEKTIPDSKGYESDPIDMTDQVITRAPLSNPFSQGGNWYRKTVNRRERQLYFKSLGGKPISYTKQKIVSRFQKNPTFVTK